MYDDHLSLRKLRQKMRSLVQDHMSLTVNLGNAASVTDPNYSILKDFHTLYVRRNRGPFREAPSLWIRGNSVLLAYTRNTHLVDEAQLDS